jgi:hypothetical protein
MLLIATWTSRLTTLASGLYLAQLIRITTMSDVRPLFGGKYPAGHHGGGMPTAEASFLDGYQHGLSWDRFYPHNKHVPGGPYVPQAHVKMHDKDWDDCMAAYRENHAEWMRGWRAGRAEALLYIESFDYEVNP